MSTDRDRRLERIYERAGSLQRRRRVLLTGGGAAAGVLVLVAALNLQRDDDRSSIVTAQPSTTSTSVGATTSTTEAGGATTTTTDPPGRSTTTTVLVCRNSMNPACGPLRFDPPPPDVPPTVSIVANPSQPLVGEEVVFTVTLDEPDRNVSPYSASSLSTPGCNGSLQPEPPDPRVVMSTDDGCAVGDPACAIGVGDPCPVRSGPWDPPEPTHVVLVYRTTYAAEGPQVVRFRTYDSGVACMRSGTCPEFTKDLAFTVLPASG